MWFKCRKCGFIFTRSQEPDLCVDCGAEYSLEEPTQEEIELHKKKLEQVRQEDWNRKDYLDK